jgi:Domain of unknown function (DUF4832)/Domain of unknown function (DUF4874)
MRLLLLALVLFAGCASPTTDAPVEAASIRLDAPKEIFESSDTNFANPDRGFYIQRVARFPERQSWVNIDANDFRRARDSGMSVVRVYTILSDLRDRALPQTVLDTITQIFTAARTAGIKVIPRFAYNFGDAPDAPLAVVLQHIDQIGAVLRANADVIAFIEAGFIGYWGEWHSSTNALIGPGQLTNDATRAILERELEQFPTSRLLAVRTPWQKRQLLGNAALTSDEAFTGTARARVGAHNDCFLASATDWGTYSSNDPRVIAEEKAFLRADNQYLPQGGETCNDSTDAQPYIGCTNALDDLARMRYSVLNEAYHPGVNARWRQDGCMPEVQRRLGYRLRLISAARTSTVRSGKRFRLQWSIQNDGFAAAYNARPIFLVLRNQATGTEARVALPHDVRRWLPGAPITLDDVISVPENLSAGAYAMFLHFPDAEPSLAARPDYALRLANANIWESATGYHRLSGSVQVR